MKCLQYEIHCICILDHDILCSQGPGPISSFSMLHAEKKIRESGDEAIFMSYLLQGTTVLQYLGAKLCPEIGELLLVVSRILNFLLNGRNEFNTICNITRTQ